MKKILIFLVAVLSYFATSTKTGSTVANSGSGTSWSNLSLAQACNNTYANVTLASSSSKYLSISNFGFSIPTTAIISGIELSVQWLSTIVDGGIAESSIQLVKEGTQSGGDKATGAPLPAGSEDISTFGGPTDLWSTTWTPSNWNSSTSGCRIKVTNIDGLMGDVAYIDCVQLTIYYTEGGVKKRAIGYFGKQNDGFLSHSLKEK